MEVAARSGILKQGTSLVTSVPFFDVKEITSLLLHILTDASFLYRKKLILLK